MTLDEIKERGFSVEPETLRVLDDCGNEFRNEEGAVEFVEGAYKEHRLYAEFAQARSDDIVFAALYDDTEFDFYEWCFDYEVDTDWEEGNG